MLFDIARQSGFSIERLVSLCEVAEAGSIGQAARGNPNRQSLLSRQIAELEQVLGVNLLARQMRPHRLTAAGQELAAAARRFLTAATDIRERGTGGPHRVIIGAGDMLIQWLLFPASEILRAQSPDWVFAFKNRTSESLIQALRRGELDLAVLPRDEVPADFESVEAWSYQQKVFAPKTLRRDRKPVEAAELATLPWAVLEGAGQFRTFLQSQAAENHIRLQVLLECSSYMQVAAAVSTGRYAGFLPAFAAQAFRGDPNIAEFELAPNLHYERCLALAWKAAHLKTRPFLHSVVEGLRQVAG